MLSVGELCNGCWHVLAAAAMMQLNLVLGSPSTIRNTMVQDLPVGEFQQKQCSKGVVWGREGAAKDVRIPIVKWNGWRPLEEGVHAVEIRWQDAWSVAVGSCYG